MKVPANMARIRTPQSISEATLVGHVSDQHKLPLAHIPLGCSCFLHAPGSRLASPHFPNHWIYLPSASYRTMHEKHTVWRIRRISLPMLEKGSLWRAEVDRTRRMSIQKVNAVSSARPGSTTHRCWHTHIQLCRVLQTHPGSSHHDSKLRHDHATIMEKSCCRNASPPVSPFHIFLEDPIARHVKTSGEAPTERDKPYHVSHRICFRHHGLHCA
ncbi:hypothetical protein P171DRAFT_47912 [Karstenula rhodostoma CBS 690.94]|uniref:Uncharacterized protein n=1 Tax=Karstenula rhodostoma CBS 690.94 TaxID=1392251 RepID=A0A9P4PET6_9PLEO|nr:hypothetical protein P171DRAFT_47912 [Karstenula rhodostoma CBS 690.94]